MSDHSESGRLIVVSNRLPVSLDKEGDGWTAKRSAGGLATAMDPILREQGGIWIGWSGAPEQTAEAAEILRREHGCEPVDLPADVAELFYEGYSNETLWPLFHSYPDRFRFAPEAWAAYQDANTRFCDAVVQHYKPGDRIWVHDYHLMLLPQLLRERLPEALVGFFLHIPFPASDVFSLLPRADELLKGVLGADLLAFHTHFHLQHFRRAVRRLLGMESKVDRLTAFARDVQLRAWPIGIAPEDFLGVLQEASTKEHTAALQQSYEGRRIIVAVDRLDYTKGLPERLRTWRTLLNSTPELREKVVLVQVAVPSRENIGSYQDLTDEVHQLVSEINGEFGSATWTPVVYSHRGISRPELVALYAFADVAWVSPLRDGMNLVAKEFVACKPQGDGVLVLSSLAGAAVEMGEALLINPYDEERTAEALLKALNMDVEERRTRMSALHERVVRNNVFAWGARFLSALDQAATDRSGPAAGSPGRLITSEVAGAFRAAAHRTLFLDYDGTLAPFTSRPQDAVPDSDLLNILTRLTKTQHTDVILISGRSVADLERWFGNVEHLGLAAEHGARWRAPGDRNWSASAVTADWKDTVRPILDHFTERTPGSCVEEKEVALVWHYRMAEPEFGEWLATELTAMLDGMLAETDLRAYSGHKIVEVKPAAANKGMFATTYLQTRNSAGFILAVGDDRTDEDLFTALPVSAWTVHVGYGQSRANYGLRDVSAVRALLSELLR
ncbi:MAG TPA: bifunctional alpha,alpha-trehalose-phosphate synthase (UDP-forming)/trehalose-phosphatase [Bryobacteraceae bacterium]|nr:bifunctional alpha,alpha-trehalose-phosphate synthase (UDP-forming)/trehalose-phosphatase [Bryobacteraceae bacterium]